MKQAASERRIDLWVVAVCTILALTLRYFFAFRSGLWRDEALFLGIVRFPEISDILQFLRHHESHPPFFYLLMRGWLRLTGGSDTAALLLPVILGGAIVPALYACGSRIFGRITGLMSAFLGAISGALVENSGLVRPYSLLPLLTLFSVYFLWNALYDPTVSGLGSRRRIWAAYIAAVACMVYTHNWSWLVVAGQWAIVLVSLLLQARMPSMKWQMTAKQGVREWLIAQSILLLIYVPWLSTLLFQAQHAGHGGGQVASVLRSLGSFGTIAVPLPYDFASYAWSGIFLILGVQCALRAQKADTGVKTEVFPLVSGIVCCLGIPIATFIPAAILNERSLFLIPRCLAMLSPCMLLVFVAIVVNISKRPSIRLCGISALAIGFLFMTLIMIGQPKSNARELAELISRQARPDDLIIISPEQLASSFNHYFQGRNEQINFPYHRRQVVTQFDNWAERFGRREALEETLHTLREAHLRGRRVWIIVLDGEYFNNLSYDDSGISQSNLKSNLIGVIRTSQIINYTNSLYGKPIAAFAPGKIPGSSATISDEVEVGLLFDPGVAHRSSPAVKEKQK